jgi:hypothetical protein
MDKQGLFFGKHPVFPCCVKYPDTPPRPSRCPILAGTGLRVARILATSERLLLAELGLRAGWATKCQGFLHFAHWRGSGMSASGRTETSPRPARTLTPAPSRAILVTYRHPRITSRSAAEAGSAGA